MGPLFAATAHQVSEVKSNTIGKNKNKKTTCKDNDLRIDEAYAKFSTHECSEGSATTAEEMRRWL